MNAPSPPSPGGDPISLPESLTPDRTAVIAEGNARDSSDGNLRALIEGVLDTPQDGQASASPPIGAFVPMHLGIVEAAWDITKVKVPFSNIPHRPWLYGTYLIRGEVTVLAAPGGAGKTALATGMAIEIATGIPILGETIWGHNLRVLFINGEDRRAEIIRRTWAFYLAHARQLSGQKLDRLHVAGADHFFMPHLSFLQTMDRFSTVNQVGLSTLETALKTLRPDVLILDPLVAFCGGGNMNDNAVMSQVVGELKRLATRTNCAFLIVHHTRKGINEGDPDAISGASAIVNLARRAIMPVLMTEEEAKKLGVLPSERPSYLKVVDAKSNFAPRLADSPWYRLHSVQIPNPEPPLFPSGDNVQAVERVYLPLQASAAVVADDHKIRDAILGVVKRGKVIDGQAYPYSPSPSGARNERGLLDDAITAVRDATLRQWQPDDLKAVVERAIKKMEADGSLVVKEMKELIDKPGRFRKGRGLAVDPSRTPPASQGTGATTPAGGATTADGGQLVNEAFND